LAQTKTKTGLKDYTSLALINPFLFFRALGNNNKLTLINSNESNQLINQIN